jgi:hypothetical protein
LKFELKALEQLINVTVHPANLTRQHQNEITQECKWILKTECEKAIEAFKSVLFTDTGQQYAEQFFRQHQIIITQLSDRVFQYQEQVYLSNTADISIYGCFGEIMGKMEELLEYLEQFFPSYFDKSLKITEAKKNTLQPAIETILNAIERGLKRIGVADDLIKIACYAFTECIGPGKILSYQHLKYLKSFEKEFEFFCKESRTGDATEEFCQFLISMNFNSFRFHNFLIKQMQEKCLQFHILAEQIRFLYLKLKLLNQQPLLHRLTLKPLLPPIKVQVGTWLNEELYFLEKQLQLSRRISETLEDLPGDQKIQTNLSVAQLSFAVKLLVEARLIRHNNSTELMRLIARNFRTIGNEDISAHSLRNKFYNIESGTLSHMKEVMTGLIQLVRQYEG